MRSVEMTKGRGINPEDMSYGDQRKEKVDSKKQEKLKQELDCSQMKEALSTFSIDDNKNKEAGRFSKDNLGRFIDAVETLRKIYENGKLSGDYSMLPIQFLVMNIYKTFNIDKFKRWYEALYDLNDAEKKKSHIVKERDPDTGFDEEKYEDKFFLDEYNEGINKIHHAVSEYEKYTSEKLSIDLPVQVEVPGY